ncbi:unnamed protein product [Pocillopora meandrina]|uniref:Uncharacterized protein n=1 Tax=Pocillopora meandrina TaxID=46732 RepID=A0AAU9XFR4_9CNID|nr:unnamed protein product [Pocillopora meandrina]
MENNMDQEITDAKSLERCLKKASLAWACTLTETIAFEVLRLEYGETEESLEEKLRRGQCVETFYNWIDDEET